MTKNPFRPPRHSSESSPVWMQVVEPLREQTAKESITIHSRPAGRTSSIMNHTVRREACPDAGAGVGGAVDADRPVETIRQHLDDGQAGWRLSDTITNASMINASMPHSVYDFRNITMAPLFHKKDMAIFQFVKRFAPVQFAKACGGDDKAIEHDLILQAALNTFDHPVKLDLPVSRAFAL